MSVKIIKVSLSKNPVNTGEKFKISVSVNETVNEPVNYRLPFRLGRERGGIK